MPTTTESKQTIIQEYRAHEQDTGSTELQIAVLTQRIKHLTNHLRTNRKDYQCLRGLLRLVGRQRRFLSYLRREDQGRYTSIISRLGLRR